MKPEALRRRVGMVFQHFNLFPDHTALQNVSLAPIKIKGIASEKAKRVAEARLSEVGLAQKFHYRPNRLSGGQQQRVSIARALAMEPEVILFDEVTSALDPELVKGILNLMADLAKRGITMIVVTHEMGFARRVSDQVVFMDEGPFLVYGDISTLHINPRAGVVILHAIVFGLQGNVGVSTENALSFAFFCVAERALRYLC